MKHLKQLKKLPLPLMAISALVLGAGCKTSHSYTASRNVPVTSTSEITPADQMEQTSSRYTAQRDVPVISTSETTAAGGTGTGSAYQSGKGSGSAHQAAAAQTGAGQSATETEILLREETVRVGTRQVDAGGVRLRKIVRTETINQPLQLRHETLVIEREPAANQGQANLQQDQGAAANAQAKAQGNAALNQPFQEQETVIRLTKEEPVVEKQVVQSGRIVAHRKMNTEQANVQQQVRREDIEINRMGNADNVTISENLKSSLQQGQSGAMSKSGSTTGHAPEAAGSSPAAGGQTAGSASSGSPITDLSTLTTTGDKSSLAGKSVKLSGAKVQKVMGDRLIDIGADENSHVFVRTAQAVQNIQPGDMVNLTGKIKAVPGTTTELGLSDEAAQALKDQPIYLDAQTVEKATQ